MRHLANRVLAIAAFLTASVWIGPASRAENSTPAATAAQKDSSSQDAKTNKPVREGKKKVSPPAAGPAQKAQAAEIKLQPEHEAQAVAFARSHHSELADLLEQLRQNSAAEYRKALQDLYRTADRLEKLRDRDAERYPLELELWKLESRIRLLTAQLLMGASVSLEADLKNLIVQRIELRSRILQLDRERATQRIATIDRELETLRADPEAAALRELDRLKKNAAKVARPAPQKNAAAPVDAKKEKDKKRRADSKPGSDK